MRQRESYTRSKVSSDDEIDGKIMSKISLNNLKGTREKKNMRSKITISILWVILALPIIFSNQLFGQDTGIVNYYPTHVGDVWKYYYSSQSRYGGCSARIRMKIASAIQLYDRTISCWFRLLIQIVAGC